MVAVSVPVAVADIAAVGITRGVGIGIVVVMLLLGALPLCVFPHLCFVTCSIRLCVFRCVTNTAAIYTSAMTVRREAVAQ